MRILFNFLGVSVLMACNPSLATGGERERNTQMRKLIDSGEWSCHYTHKSVLAVNSMGAIGDVPRLCVTGGKCEKVRGGAGGRWIFNLACKASGRETCPELKDCIKAEGPYNFDWEDGRETTKEPQRKGRDKYGRNCRYAWAQPLVVYRNDSKTGTLDAVCATPIACDSFERGPKHHVVACPATGSIVKEEDGLEYDVCPKVNDCIDNELPLERAFTAAELQQLQARARLQTSAPAKANHRP